MMSNYRSEVQVSFLINFGARVSLWPSCPAGVRPCSMDSHAGNSL